MSTADTVKNLSNKFYPYAQKRMGFDKPAQIKFVEDPENAQNPLGKTAFYEPDSMTVTLFVTNRHPKDILRSLSHELVHHTQNCRGEFSDGFMASEGYAQSDPHLREMEKEAYEQGNLVFRDFEDEYKSNNSEESLMEHFDVRRIKLNQQLMKKFGYKSKDNSEKEPSDEKAEEKKSKEKE